MTQDPYILSNPPKRQPISGQKQYLVNINTVITGVNTPVTSKVAYHLDIDFSDHFFTLMKSNLVVDGKTVPSKMNEFYLKTAIPLNHIDLKCNRDGEIKELYKHDRLLKTWKQTKKKLQYEFKGKSVDQLIKHLDKSYANKGGLIQKLGKDQILQLFYRSFISDYLIYYGQSNTTYSSVGLLGSIALSFSGVSTLDLKGEQLHLQIDSNLNKKNIHTEVLENYFKNKVDTFNIENLQVKQHYRTLLDYNSVWINQSTFTQTVQIGNYRKESILTLQHQ